MKFHQLAIGAQFQFKGTVHTKVSPVMATDGSGKQVFMKRSDEVGPVTDSLAPESTESRGPEHVLAGALSQYTHRAMEIVQRNFHPAEAATLQRVHAQLQELEQNLIHECMAELD